MLTVTAGPSLHEPPAVGIYGRLHGTRTTAPLLLAPAETIRCVWLSASPARTCLLARAPTQGCSYRLRATPTTASSPSLYGSSVCLLSGLSSRLSQCLAPFLMPALCAGGRQVAQHPLHLCRRLTRGGTPSRSREGCAADGGFGLLV